MEVKAVILVDELVRRVITRMSNRCSNSRSTSSSKCAVVEVVVEEVKAMVEIRAMETVVDRLRGRACMMMCRNQTRQRIVVGEVSKEVGVVEGAAIGARFHHRVPLQARHLQMLPRDQRTRASRVRTIVVEAGGATEVSILMLGDR